MDARLAEAWIAALNPGTAIVRHVLEHPAHERGIALDRTAHLRLMRRRNHFTDAMKQVPTALLLASDRAGDLARTHTVPAVDDHPDRRDPLIRAQGQMMFPVPRKVVRVEEHEGEEFACVLGDDGTEGWAPVSQLSIETPVSLMLPKPTFKPPFVADRPAPEGQEESRWKLPSGNAVLRYPTTLTRRDFKVLKRQIELLEFSAFGDEDEGQSKE